VFLEGSGRFCARQRVGWSRKKWRTRVLAAAAFGTQLMADFSAGDSGCASVVHFAIRTSGRSAFRNSSICELGIGWRSILLGVKRERLRHRRRTCRRSMWKMHAAVEGWQICMLSSAASCMKRSMRALESPAPAFVAVRRDHNPGRQVPFVLAPPDELVDDDLRAVGKIAELRFPQNERLG